VEFNPERLQEVAERLDTLFGLKRKYGNTIEDILAYKEQAAAELDSLTHSEERRQDCWTPSSACGARPAFWRGGFPRRVRRRRARFASR
jgi:DNA repair ATPase RecN